MATLDEIIDGLQQASDLVTGILPAPFGKVIPTANIIIDIKQQSDSSDIPTYKIVIANIAQATVSIITGTILSAAVLEASTIAFATSGPGGAVIFIEGSFLTIKATNSLGDATNRLALEALTSKEFIEFENGIGNTLLEYRNSFRNAVENLSTLPNLAQMIAERFINNLTTTFTDISDTTSQAYQEFIDSVAAAIVVPRTDPLIIDINGDGIELDSWQNSNALFDLNSDGTSENTGWTKVNSDDSFLVIDKNNNGNIDDITEMFGSATVPGFIELKKYDSNGDNLINSPDSQFNLLRLWNDTNGNGVVEAGFILFAHLLGLRVPSSFCSPSNWSSH